MGVAEYDERPFKVDIRDGVGFFEWPDGTVRCMPLRTMRIDHARVGKALAEYDARKAEVVQLRRGRRHAARS